MSLGLFFEEKNRVLRVAELALAIKQLLESEVPLLWVRGEISNLVKAASGHYYFSLKDDQAQVRCVMFRHKNQLLSNSLGNGQQIEVLAAATLYEQRGDFQLTVEQVRPAGQGVLYERFAQLKLKLQSEGLFDAARKRPLPRHPERIGIVTSLQAAALRDVLATLRGRQPGVPVVLYPAPVQGTGSAEQIAAALRSASQRKECDVLIVCRGGGSIEDLWAFNEEVVARAIAASAIPVVSGVGHETDFTIADFVADERAPTPTAAAQRVAPDRHALLRTLRDLAQHLRRAQRNRLQNAIQTADYLQRRLVHPAQQLQYRAQQLEQLRQRIQRAYAYRKQHRHWQWQALAQRLRAASGGSSRLQDRQANLAARLGNAMRMLHMQQSARVENIAQHLALLDPAQVLARGYSMVQDADGRVVSDAGGLAVGAELRITFASGWARTEVKERGGK
ncbi:MAG: exodeoxyribonuclease VII large subunit [Gallionellales bacterium RIFCSPLOWO2_12_FULL_59_22]|nr:MAG: exodeoxyribonuclease VII large subunit [Gallionellales bacterium RIFCSPLOWO2_02_FULL_59_110]OGT02691.1 MAG: exodeoxyribonuclease VII large subunit [Gallionellales bacterium RIFCSPLOWO2_02_58_13]OGT11086.1 MAG: exodeoxyribonuclease VII large subunit [Gallionellales bacterium RIFCSPLOWO2_12_FULL_59_22]